MQKWFLFQSTLDDDDLADEGNGSISDSGTMSADELGNVDMEDSVNTSGFETSLEAAANKGKVLFRLELGQKAMQIENRPEILLVQ